jgi:hypothetical protein
MDSEHCNPLVQITGSLPCSCEHYNEFCCSKNSSRKGKFLSYIITFIIDLTDSHITSLDLLQFQIFTVGILDSSIFTYIALQCLDLLC